MTYLGRKSVRVQHEHGLPCLPHKLEPENPGSKWSDYTAALFVKQHWGVGGGGGEGGGGRRDTRVATLPPST